MADDKFVQLCPLWESEKGYLSGNLGDVRVFIFKNKNRKTEKSPTHRLVVVPSERKPQPKSDESADF